MSLQFQTLLQTLVNDLGLIALYLCSFELMLYVPVNSNGFVFMSDEVTTFVS